MLAHQHTEGGRCLGVLEALLRQADPGRAAACREQQRIGLGAGAQGQHQFIAGGFKYFCDLRIGQGLFQLPSRQRQRRGIKCHLIITCFSDRISYSFTQNAPVLPRAPLLGNDDDRRQWREELLGPRPAGHECNPLHEVDAGSRNPYAGAKRLRGFIRLLYI